MKLKYFIIAAVAVFLINGTASGSEDRIQLPADSTGKKTRTTTQSISGHDVHSSVVNVGDPDNANICNINSDGSLDIRTRSASSVIDTTTTPLASGASYTTSWFDTSTGGQNFVIAVKTNKKGRVTHEESHDGVTTSFSHALIVDVNENHTEEHMTHARYSRFVLTNTDSGAQSSLVMQVIQAIYPQTEVQSYATQDATQTPLASGATYTTPWFNTKGRSNGLAISGYADQSGTIYIDLSPDNGTTVSVIDPDSYIAGTVFEEIHIINAAYARVRWENGATPQSSFWFQVMQRIDPPTQMVKIDSSHNAVSQAAEGSPWEIQGSKTNNAAASGATNFGTFPAVATTTPPTYTNGYQVALSTTTAGDLRISLDGEIASTTVKDGQGDSAMDDANDALRSNVVIFPDNEPFNFAQYGGVATGSGNAVHVQPGAGISFPVTDNSGSLTVDAPAATPVPMALTNTSDAVVKAGDAVNNAVRVNVVAGGAGDGSILDGVSSSIKATVFDYTSANPLSVRLSDTNGDYVSVGGGTQYSDGAAQATPIGTVTLGHDGTNVRAVTTDASGDLQVDVLTIPNLTIATFPDNEPFNLAQYGGLAVGATNGLHVQPGTGATWTVTDGAGSLNTILDSGTLTSITNAVTVAQATGSNLHAVIDSGSTTAVTQATAANLNATVVQATGSNLHTVVDSGTITTITNAVTVTDGAGAMNVIVDSGTVTANQGTANTSANRWPVYLTDGTTNQAINTSGGAEVTGDIAHNATDGGNPVKIGGVARTAWPTAATTGNRTDGTYSTLGQLVSVVNCPRDLIAQQQTTITNSTAETTILTALASTHHDLTALDITNASATAVTVTIKDATAGTTRAIYDLAANGGLVKTWINPFIQAAAVNNNWTATLSVNTVTVHFTVQACKML